MSLPLLNDTWGLGEVLSAAIPIQQPFSEADWAVLFVDLEAFSESELVALQAAADVLKQGCQMVIEQGTYRPEAAS